MYHSKFGGLWVDRLDAQVAEMHFGVKALNKIFRLVTAARCEIAKVKSLYL